MPLYVTSADSPRYAPRHESQGVAAQTRLWRRSYARRQSGTAPRRWPPGHVPRNCPEAARGPNCGGPHASRGHAPEDMRSGACPSSITGTCSRRRRSALRVAVVRAAARPPRRPRRRRGGQASGELPRRRTALRGSSPSGAMVHRRCARGVDLESQHVDRDVAMNRLTHDDARRAPGVGEFGARDVL